MELRINLFLSKAKRVSAKYAIYPEPEDIKGQKNMSLFLIYSPVLQGCAIVYLSYTLQVDIRNGSHNRKRALMSYKKHYENMPIQIY